MATISLDDLRSKFKEADAAHSVLREAGGYGAGYALGYRDAIGELLEQLTDSVSPLSPQASEPTDAP